MSVHDRPGGRLAFPAAVAVTALTAFALGWYSHPSGQQTAGLPTGVSPNPASTVRPPRTVGTPADPAEVAARLEKALEEPGDYRQQLRLGKAAARLDRAAVEAAVDAEEARGPQEIRANVVTALLGRFAELDPAAATVRGAGLYEKPGVANSQYQWLEVPLTVWRTDDPKAAQAWADGLPRSGTLRSMARRVLLLLATQSDPEEALQELLASDDQELANQEIEIFSQLAKRNLPAAAAQANGLPQKDKSGALIGVLSVWTERDPAAAYAWIGSVVQSSADRANAITNFYSSWSSRDPAAASAWALAHELAPGSQTGRRIDFGNIVTNLAERDLGAAQDFVARMPVWCQESARGLLGMYWARRDPVGAIDYLSLHPGKGDNLLLNGLGSWAGEDLPEARAWAERLPPGKARAQAMDRIYSSWSDKDPQGCLEHMLAHRGELAEPLGTNSNFERIMSAWSEENPAAVLQWCQEVKDTGARDTALRTAISTLAETDPLKGASLLGQISAAGRAEAATQIVAGLAGVRPEAAVRMVESLPPDETRNSAAESLVSRWMNDDPQAARAWMVAQPTGPTRDALIGSAIDGLIQEDGIKKTLPLLDMVQDAGSKETTAAAVAGRYIGLDPEAAKTWISSSPLFSPEQRTTLLEQALAASDREKTNGGAGTGNVLPGR